MLCYVSFISKVDLSEPLKLTKLFFSLLNDRESQKEKPFKRVFFWDRPKLLSFVGKRLFVAGKIDNESTFEKKLLIYRKENLINSEFERFFRKPRNRDAHLSFLEKGPFE